MLLAKRMDYLPRLLFILSHNSIMALTSILFADLMLQAPIVFITLASCAAYIDIDHVRLSQHTAFFQFPK